MWEIEQIQTKKMSEDVAEQIKNIISEGELQPGDRLPSVRSLSESFQVGQSTIREAFSALKTIGLIETRQGEGTFVRNYDSVSLHQPIADYIFLRKEDIIDLLDVRKMLERGTVALAAKRRTNADLLKIEKAIEQMKQDLSSKNFGEEADWAFHFAVAEASKNQIVISLMEELSAKIKKALKASRTRLYEMREMPEKLLNEHRNIFLAIQEKNVELAEKRMVAHLLGVQEQMLAIDLSEMEEETII